jgi:CRISPR system Cascade subunit CasC
MSATIQVHLLTSYAASLLNRDDAGFAKRIVFGGHPRIRISSQCMKRAWRESLMAMNEDDLPTGIRSDSVFETLVLPAVVARGIDEARAREGLAALIAKTVKGDRTGATSLVTKQSVLLGNREVRALAQAVSEALGQPGEPKALIDALLAAKLPKKTLNNLLGVDDPLAYGVESALFGRFVTSDVIARTDSSVSVAHAQTVHAAAPELDFFSAVDDLGAGSGAAHIGESELSAGLFYQYLSIDLATLSANLTGCEPAQWRKQDPTLLTRVVGLLVQLAATRSPGAKKGATAPYALSEFVLLEVGNGEPRQLANAFRKPVAASAEDMLHVAVGALSRHLGQLDQMYGIDTERHFATTCEDQTVTSASRAPSLQAAIASTMAAALRQD